MVRASRWLKPLVLALLAIVAVGAHATTRPPPVGHVFVIVLENKGFEETFGPDSKAPYFSKALTKQGVLLTQYFGTAHYSLGNYLAMISGQGGTHETRDDCEVFEDFVSTGPTPDGQEKGKGCVYPASVKTLPDQLVAIGKSWRGYMEDLGNDPRRESATCGAPKIGAADPTQHARKDDQYAARHNPFVYFHSLLDGGACAANVGPLARLEADLKSVATTPNFVFISPNLCNDGHDAPCKDGAPGGLVSADAFLKTWVKRIMASPAYRKDGLLIVTFDEGDGESRRLADGRISDVFEGASCCAQQPGPNIGTFPSTESDDKYVIEMRGFGGDRTGAVLVSPFLQPGTVSVTPFNHYSMLKTLQDLYGAKPYLGYAGQAGLVGFFDAGSDVKTRHRRTKGR
jgi:phospholipase C